jgi:DNA-binding CsgD family transcriptional regulator
MKKSVPTPVNYARYLKQWENSLKSTETITYPAFLHNSGEDNFALIPSIVYLWDIKHMKYLYFSKNVLEHTGYPAEEFLAKGPHFAFSLVHPEDVPHIIENVQKTQLDFLQGLPAGEYTNYRFTYNYRIRRADGEYIQILTQENFLQADNKGNPLLSFGTISDVTPIIKDTAITLSIHKLSPEDGFISSLYSFKDQEKILSIRETQVLKLIMQGYTTEEIAEKLHISPYTVKNHRSHMLGKTQMNTMPELISYALQKGFL